MTAKKILGAMVTVKGIYSRITRALAVISGSQPSIALDEDIITVFRVCPQNFS